MEKENWINDVLNSTDGMVRTAPADALFDKIQRRIKAAGYVSAKTVSLVAASIVILALINIAAIRHQSQQGKNTTSALASTFNQSNQLY